MDESIFDRMVRWGAERDWNRSEIAVRLGISPQHLSNWRNRGVPAQWHAPIAQLFSRSVDELLGLAADTPHEFLQKEWPFEVLDELKIRQLDPKVRDRLEGAFLLTAAQLGLDLYKQK